MASLRSLTRNDGSSYVQVLYRLDGKQTSTSFHDMGSATSSRSSSLPSCAPRVLLSIAFA